MTGRNVVNTGTSGSAASSDHNQPMDLAQKSQTARIADAVTSVVKGGTTLVQFGSTQLMASSASTHVVTCKSGVKNEGGASGTSGVTLFSRQSQGPLNLVAPNTGTSLNTFSSNVTVPARSVSHSNSASVTAASHPTSAYHIPRGAAAAANMTASRSQNLSSLVRTTPQTVGTPNSATLNSPRANIISQRMVPISNSSWIARSTSTTAVLTTKPAYSQVTGRTTITPSRSSQSPVMPITTYHGGTVKSGAIVAGPIRSQGPSTLKVGTATEGPRLPHAPKGIHISNSISHTQKYTAGNVRGVGASSLISPVNVGTSIGGNATVYTPTSTLVTSLASSGTTITPHPGNRNQAPNTVRLTSGVTSVFSQASTHGNVTSFGGGICLSSSSAAVITHHPTTFNRAQSVEQVPLKTPLVRTSHPSTQSHTIKGNATGLPAGTHISFSGQRVLAQSTQGPSLALAQLSNVTGPKTPGTVITTQAGISTVPFQSRSGTTVASSLSRGTGSTISMTKVIPQSSKGTVTQGLSSTIPMITSTPTQPGQSVASLQPIQQPQQQPSHPTPANDAPPPHTSVFLQRAPPHSAVTMTTGITVSQPERTLATVTQYNISAPFYLEPTNHNTFPVSASIVPANHYIPTTITASTLRVGNNGVSSSGGTVTTDAGTHQSVSVPIIKPNASPRPSILRKRPDVESVVPLKAAKNLSTALNIPMTSPPSPIRPDSRGNGNVSSGSTTVSANSSPGVQLKDDDSTVSNLKSAKLEPASEDNCVPPAPCIISFPVTSRPPSVGTVPVADSAITANISDKMSLCGQASVAVPAGVPHISEGVSPRKKPRKQQLNELHEARSSEEDFEQPVLKKIKKEVPCNKTANVAAPPPESDEERETWSEPVVPKVETWREATLSPEPVNKRRQMSLISTYRQTWKGRHNHFSRHTDVRPKEEKKRTVNEIANQKLAMQRVNGWKVMHLSGQVEDLVDMESDVIDRLQVILNAIEKRQQFRKPYKDFDKDVNRLSELVKANIQRSVIIKDQMADAKIQMSNIFNHKDNIVNILTKYSNKRTLRKKEKS